MNCTEPQLSCLGAPDSSSWLNRYISSNQEICRCENHTMGGPSCSTPCPGLVNDKPCNDRGECWYPNATCVCDSGYKGKSCGGVCPKTYGNQCAGKGLCVQDGEDGAICECFAGFRGPGCNIECAGGAGRPCSARGFCEEDGSCTCVGGWRGPECSWECPGTNILPCSLHGVCTIDAKCECESLYRGDACQYKCPDVLGIPCGARGMCNGTGQCECNFGYRGETCMVECPGGAGNPCNGHGECNATGFCQCSPGWAGNACTEVCPRGVRPAPARPCAPPARPCTRPAGARALRRGPARGQVCPGGRENPCSGHGECLTRPDEYRCPARSRAAPRARQSRARRGARASTGPKCGRTRRQVARVRLLAGAGRGGGRPALRGRGVREGGVQPAAREQQHGRAAPPPSPLFLLWLSPAGCPGRRSTGPRSSRSRRPRPCRAQPRRAAPTAPAGRGAAHLPRSSPQAAVP